MKSYKRKEVVKMTNAYKDLHDAQHPRTESNETSQKPSVPKIQQGAKLIVRHDNTEENPELEKLKELRQKQLDQKRAQSYYETGTY